MKYVIIVCLFLGLTLFIIPPYQESYKRIESVKVLKTVVVKKTVKKFKRLQYIPPSGEALELAQYVSKETGYDVELVSKIMFAENPNYKPNAKNVNTNGSIDYLYFQINSQHISEAKSKGLDIVNNPHDNATFAIILMKRNGLRDWGYSKNKWSVM